MRTARDRRESTHVDCSPEALDGPACQQALTERSHKPRGMLRLAPHVHVVSPLLACGTAAWTRHAVVYRPQQAEALAWRGATCGLDVVARLGE